MRASLTSVTAFLAALTLIHGYSTVPSPSSSSFISRVRSDASMTKSHYSISSSSPHHSTTITNRRWRRTSTSNSALLSMNAITSYFTKTARQIGAPTATAAATAAILGTAAVKIILDRPIRTYGNGTVAKEYDSWTQDGILEYYWGEHIHLGYYDDNDNNNGQWRKKNFIEAKYDFVDEMMKLGSIDPNLDAGAKVLDVGCGVGGTSRYLAKKLGTNADITGITLSPNQRNRATELALEQGVQNANFQVMNALEMDFPDNTFDIVWACESGEHMPDKAKYIQEMMRVLKPGGKYVMATWCQRDDRDVPFDARDERDLRFLYEQWTHPYFISIEAYKDLIDSTGLMEEVSTADWVNETIASWRHSVWVGIVDPRGWIFKPRKYLKCVRDAWCLERMHRAFKRGLMQYGMFAAQKKKKED